MGSDDSTLGEKMNRGMYLDPGFTQDKPNLVGALRDDIDSTTARAQANVDQTRQNDADVERIAKEMAREAKSKEAALDKSDTPDEPKPAV
jgi:hypothetical protein